MATELDSNFFYKMIDNSYQGMFVVKVELDQDGSPRDWMVVYANDAVIALGPLSKEQMVEHWFGELYPEGDTKWLQMYYEAAYLDKAQYADEYSDEIGTMLHLRVLPTGMKGYCFICIEDDNSEFLKRERQHQLRLQESNQQLQAALEEAREGTKIISTLAALYVFIISINIETEEFSVIRGREIVRNVTGNGGFVRDVVEKTLNSFVAAEFQDKVRNFFNLETLADRLWGQDAIAVEYQSFDRLWFVGRFVVKKRDKAGRAVEVLYAVRDISQDKEQELAYHERLKQIAQEAKKANISKTDFLRRMSHDIRTPINGIRGMLEIARYYQDDIVKRDECREKIWEATEHLLSLVNDVLDMNKLESGNITLQNKPFSLRKVLSEINAVTESQALEMNVRYWEDRDATNIVHDRLIGSPVHLKQAIMNFTSNAVKYNRENGEVKAYCWEVSHGEDTAMFEFVCEDTGIGMSKDFQQKAFEPFAQEEQDAARTSYKGTGLGMSIAKCLVELMGGKIELYSREGKGTTVICRIPFAIDHSMSQTAKSVAYRDVRLDEVQLMLVEDNELNAEIAQFMLEKHGAKVRWAQNGREAVEAFRAEPGAYDAIIMDIMMPVMNGLEAARTIRQLDCPEAGTVPIFAMTANAFVDDVQRSMEAGMDEHLTKPIREKDIVRALCKHVAKLQK